MNTTSKRLPEFEVVRGIAILLLLVHHSGFYGLDLWGFSPQGLSPYFEAFLLGTFFFLSGYFTETSLQRSGGNLAGFFISRNIKVFPPYLVALALYISVLGITLKERYDLLVYATGVQFIFAGAVKPIVTLWYVGAILVYYVIFALLWKVTPNMTGFISVAAILFILALLLYYATGLLDVRFFKYYFVFLTGMLFARLDESSGILSSRYLLAKGALAILGVSAFSLALTANPVSPSYIFASYIFIVSGTLLLFALIASLHIASPWRWVTAISHASYFAYLFHRPFWKLIEDQIPLQGLQNQILFRMLPASLVVLVACYFLQQSYDYLVGLFKRQSQRPSLTF